MSKGKTIRPFATSAKVYCRGYSTALQRVIVDFGADESLQKTQKKIKEHYRLDLPTSSIGKILKENAKQIYEYVATTEANGYEDLYEKGDSALIIVEMDGGMVPVVDTDIPENATSSDRRKNRKLRWQEARVVLARSHTKIIPTYYATMKDVNHTGDLLRKATLREGLGPKTKVHGVGDGAKWISDQTDRVFGNQAKYLVDFYHVSEYLSDAGEYLWKDKKAAWIKEKHELLRNNKCSEILEELKEKLPQSKEPPVEGKSTIKEENPLEKCYRYLSNKQAYLDYKGALEKGLPIGSGEIESAHRHIVQDRIKLSGAWWKEETLEHMLTLRTLRANGDWGKYWQSRLKVA